MTSQELQEILSDYEELNQEYYRRILNVDGRALSQIQAAFRERYQSEIHLNYAEQLLTAYRERQKTAATAP